MNCRDEILSKIHSIQMMPASTIEVIQLLQDPDVSISKLSRTIEYDPGLTSNILRLANSSYFGFSRAINSIKEAIVRLGTKDIFRLVMTSAVAPITQSTVKGYDLPSGELWRHSAAVAIGSDQLAAALGIKPPDHTFTAALLHDIGKIVLGTFVEVDASPIMGLAFTDHVSFVEAEHKVLGIDHAEVGSVFLAEWGLPSELVEVVRWHHEPECLKGDLLAVDLVHVADILCLMSGVGLGGIDGLNYHVSNDVSSRLHLTIRITEKVISQIHEELNKLEIIFVQQEITK